MTFNLGMWLCTSPNTTSQFSKFTLWLFVLHKAKKCYSTKKTITWKTILSTLLPKTYPCSSTLKLLPFKGPLKKLKINKKPYSSEAGIFAASKRMVNAFYKCRTVKNCSVAYRPRFLHPRDFRRQYCLEKPQFWLRAGFQPCQLLAVKTLIAAYQ